jgi:hypothetical protein
VLQPSARLACPSGFRRRGQRRCRRLARRLPFVRCTAWSCVSVRCTERRCMESGYVPSSARDPARWPIGRFRRRFASPTTSPRDGRLLDGGSRSGSLTTTSTGLPRSGELAACLRLRRVRGCNPAAELWRSRVAARRALGYSPTHRCYGVRLRLQALLVSRNKQTTQTISASARTIIHCGRFRPG